MMRLHAGRAAITGSFAPSDLSSLKMWLDADDLAIANGVAFNGSTWVDRQGNQNATGGDASNPSMVTGAANGHKALSWGGSSSTARLTAGTTILGSATQVAMFAPRIAARRVQR
jgi:hypothetical protein